MGISKPTKKDLEERCRALEAALAGKDDNTERLVAEAAMRSSERRFRETLERIEMIAVELDPQGRLLFCNDFLLRLTGWSREEILGQDWFDRLIPAETRDAVRAIHQANIDSAAARLRFENPILTRSGDLRHIIWTNTPLRDAQGNVASVISLGEDATERLRRQTEYGQILQTAMGGFLLLDMEGRFMEVNAATAQMLGYTPDEMKSLRLSDIEAMESLDDIRRHTKELIKKGHLRFETRHRRKDGSLFDAEVSCSYVPQGGGRIVAFVRDITRQKRDQHEREYTIHLLRALGQPNGLRDLMQDIIHLLRQWSGCEAVGIRLRDGEDFPYYETRGFPPEFVEAENRLCALDEKGEMIRDSQGNPVLECMCGNVLCGRFNPGLPFFTEFGSFWTNSTTDLLASTSEADRQARTRNRCHGEGYESVALIPLRYIGGILGLLQLNDPRRNRFTREDIALFERLAHNLAIGLAQRQAAEALRESEERFRNLFENAPLGYQSLDINGNFIEVNETWCKVLGYAKHEIIGHNFSEFIHPDFRDVFRENFPRFKRLGYILGVEFEMIRKDGSEIVVSFDGRIGHDAGGAFKQTNCVLSDITERKRAEEALKQSERRFRALFENSPIAVWEEDFSAIKTRFDELRQAGRRDLAAFLDENPDEVAALAARVRILDVNQASVEVLRADGKEQVARELPQYFDEDSLRVFRDEMIALWNGQTAFRCEIPIRNSRGERRLLDLSLSIPPGHEHDLARVYVSFNDITERRSAEQEIRENEARFRALFETAADAIFIVDPESGRILDANRQAETLTGRTHDDIVGLHHSALHPPEERERSRIRFSESVVDQGRRFGENCVLHRDGRRIPVEISSGGVVIAGGRPIHIGIFRDISERKEAEARLADQLEELRRWRDVTLGRENRVMELKREVNELLAQAGRPPRYNSVG